MSTHVYTRESIYDGLAAVKSWLEDSIPGLESVTITNASMLEQLLSQIVYVAHMPAAIVVLDGVSMVGDGVSIRTNTRRLRIGVVIVGHYHAGLDRGTESVWDFADLLDRDLMGAAGSQRPTIGNKTTWITSISPLAAGEDRVAIKINIETNQAATIVVAAEQGEE